MLKKIIKKVQRKLTKITVLDRIFIDESEYRVIETTSILPSIKNKRSLSFKKDGRIYHHSVIHLNSKYHFQPSYPIPQKIISTWSNSNQINNALVLGCAGCTIPRFLALHFPKSHTTGVEISEEFIDIAKKYFLIDEISDRFEIIHSDAFEYVKENSPKQKQNIIYVDIFDNNKLIDELFSDDFIKALSNYADDNSIVIFNLLGKSVPEITRFAENIGLSYNGKYVISPIQEEIPTNFLALVKTDSEKNIADFEERLKSLDYNTYTI